MNIIDEVVADGAVFVGLLLLLLFLVVVVLFLNSEVSSASTACPSSSSVAGLSSGSVPLSISRLEISSKVKSSSRCATYYPQAVSAFEAHMFADRLLEQLADQETQHSVQRMRQIVQAANEENERNAEEELDAVL